MKKINKERQAHLEIFGYDDPYLDLNDDSLRSAKVKCYMESKGLASIYNKNLLI